MPRLFKLLGSLEITQECRPSPVVKSFKGSALLSYLIVTRQAHSREAVADLLWEAISTRQSLKNLRSLLPRIRQWIPELAISRETISFQPQPDTIVDLFQHEAKLETSDWSQLDQALRLYQGNLLAGFYIDDAPRFNEWLFLTRERLRMRMLDGYQRLCAAYADQGLWSQGIETARRWLAIDELDEAALRKLLSFLAASGQAGAALQQYNYSKQRLWEALGVEPEPETIELVHNLEDIQAHKTDRLIWDFAQVPTTNLPELGVLAEPGALPPNTCLPYRRNEDFTGRQDTLLQLAKLLLPRPDTAGEVKGAVAITGMGGLGKTQLAVEFAYRYGRYYPGGVYWISFAEAQNVAEEVAAIGGERGMGLFQEAERLTLADQVGRVQRAWQEPLPRLLIFDNCEEEDLLTEWLPVTGGCRVLITCRRGNWSREHQITTLSLSVLSPAESVSFLQQLVPRVTDQEAAEIAAEMGHLPLALHLAGSFLRRYPQVSAVQYLAQLRSKKLLQHPSLQGRGITHSPTGHELEVARTFSVNLKQLDPSMETDAVARQILARAACFAPGKPVARNLLLSTVQANSEELLANLLAEDGLARLVALGFLKMESDGFVVMHPLLVAFTKDSVLDSGAQVAVEQAMLLHLSPQLEEVRYLGKLTFSLDNLRFVTDTALKLSSEQAPRLAAALGRHLREIGEFKSAQLVLEKAIAAAEKVGDIGTLGRAGVLLSRALESQGIDKDALQYLERAEYWLRMANPPNPVWLAEALHRKGWVFFRLGQASAAQKAANESRELGEEAHHLYTIGNSYNLLGVIAYYLLSDHELASRYLIQALGLFREIGDRFAEGTVLTNLGENARIQGNYPEARRYYQASVETAQEIGNRTREMIYLLNLSSAQVGLGMYDVAAVSLLKVIAYGPKDWRILSEAHRFLAEAYIGQRNPILALEAAQIALAYAKSSNYPYDIGQAWRLLGCIAHQMNAPVPAEAQQATTYDAPACFAAEFSGFLRLETGTKSRRCVVELGAIRIILWNQMRR